MAWMVKVRCGWRVWSAEETRAVCARARAERRVPMWIVVVVGGVVEGSSERGWGEEGGGPWAGAGPASGGEGEEGWGSEGEEGSVAIVGVMGTGGRGGKGK